MKYYDMLSGLTWMRSIKSQTVVTPKMEAAIEQQIVPVVEAPVNETPTFDATSREEVLGLLRDIKEKMVMPSEASEDSTKTLLTEEEVSNVLDIMLEYQDKYFEATPISETLVKAFIWNIPRSIYNIAMKAHSEGAPACLNPLYWFYPFCINDEMMDIGFFNAIATANAEISDEEYQLLAGKAEEYETLWAESKI